MSLGKQGCLGSTMIPTANNLFSDVKGARHFPHGEVYTVFNYAMVKQLYCTCNANDMVVEAKSRKDVQEAFDTIIQWAKENDLKICKKK
jgi:hypothetical protein